MLCCLSILKQFNTPLFRTFLYFMADFIYRKIELYSMLWADRVDLSKYIVAAGCFGGPIGKRSSNYKLKDSVLYMYFLSLLVCTKSI